MPRESVTKQCKAFRQATFKTIDSAGSGSSGRSYGAKLSPDIKVRPQRVTMAQVGYLTNIASEFYVVSVLSRIGLDE